MEFTRCKYLAAHNAVVASPTYGKAMGIAEGMVKRVQVRQGRPSLAALMEVEHVLAFMGGALSQSCVHGHGVVAGCCWAIMAFLLSTTLRIKARQVQQMIIALFLALWL